jgi:hypothetical protein
MLRKIKQNLESGVEKIKWFATVLNERLKIEFSVVKLLYQSNQMEKQKDELMNTIGKRVFELKAGPDKHILKDRIIADCLNEIDHLDAEIESTKKKASEMSSTE